MAEIIKESPFSPGKPVQPEYFVARTKEIQRLERAVRQTVAGKNENIFITGQRGIGKSSLAKFIRYFAEKEYDFVGSHCFLGGVRSLEDMMGVIFQRVLQDSADKSLFDRLKEMFASYIKGFTFFGLGVEFTRDKGELRTLVDNFLPVLRKLYEQILSIGKKGLVLILDDLNGITDVPQFSQFLKSFVDELATSGRPLPLFLILVGLPSRWDEMIRHQPSTARIFNIIDLPLMTISESQDFFNNMFGGQGIIVTSEAMSLMVELSGGYPMLMHEVGDAVFWQDNDKNIDIKDARDGIDEAAENVGRRHIAPQISQVLKSEVFPSILWQVAEILPIGTSFRRQDIIKKLSDREKKNIDNFLSRMTQRGIIEEGQGCGEYRFVNPLYHLHVWHTARREKTDEKSS